MEQLKNIIKEARENLVEAFTDFPMELEIPATPCVIAMNTEGGDITILGRVKIVKIGPLGQIWDDEGSVYSFHNRQFIYAVEDMCELHKVVLEAAKKKLADEGFNEEE